MIDYNEILDFWFAPDSQEERMQLWFRKNPEVDAEMRTRFSDALQQAREGKLDAWKQKPRSLLSYVILLDQFSRNIHRNTPDAFSTDPLALEASKQAVASGMDRQVPDLVERAFFYLPFEHSEDLADQDHCIRLYEGLSAEAPEEQRKIFEGYVDYALAHQRIIKRFGRFPHRNIILGRRSTEEEIAFLKEPGSSF